MWLIGMTHAIPVAAELLATLSCTPANTALLLSARFNAQNHKICTLCAVLLLQLHLTLMPLVFNIWHSKNK